MKNKKVFVTAAVVGVLCILIAIVGILKVVVWDNRDYDTFPEGYKIASVDVGGKTIAEAKKALQNAVGEYEVIVTLDDQTFTLKQESLELKFNDKADMQALCNAANREEKPEKEIKLFEMKDEAGLEEILQEAYITAKVQAETDVQSEGADEAGDATGEESEQTQEFDPHSLTPYKATIAYNAEAGCFEGVDGTTGEAKTFKEAAQNLSKAVDELKATVELESKLEQVEGEIAADSEEVQKALENANEYLALQIICNFAPEGKEATQEQVPAADIASWLIVSNDGLSVELNGETMSTYCNELARKHDVSKTRKAKFKTASGSDITVNVAAAGQTVDGNALFTEISGAIEDKQSKTVEAVYSVVEEAAEGEYVDFGGNYCEVDLTNQMVYVYKDGQQVVASQCVTGCVAKGNGTPTGVYHIFSMDKDRYLRGPGYKTWVNFFVPFNGGIGFHDASWRSTFGGNIYLYNGSHGCINMPYSAVKQLFDNVTMGETVVVHGGGTAQLKDQIWTGSNAYTVDAGSGAFHLDAACQDGAALTYSSNNPGVASVDAAGNVTVGGAGTATITITAAETKYYKASTFTVTITVNQPAPVYVDPSLQASGMTLGQGTSGAIGVSTNSPGGRSFQVISGAECITVDGNGNVTAIAPGTAVVRVTVAAAGNFNAKSVDVTVVVTP